MLQKILPVIVILSLLACVRPLFGQEASFEIPRKAAPKAVETPKKRQIFRGNYTTSRRKKIYKEICNLILLDGRYEYFYEVLTSNARNDKNCIACKSLFKSWASSCRIKKSRRRKVKKHHGKDQKEGSKDDDEDTEKEVVDPTPTPFSLQRVPNAELLALIGGIFREYAEDKEERSFETLIAVDKLVKILRDPSDKTKAAAEYFDHLSEYIYAPFARLRLKRDKFEKAEQEAQEIEEGKEAFNVDQLFDF